MLSAQSMRVMMLMTSRSSIAHHHHHDRSDLTCDRHVMSFGMCAVHRHTSGSIDSMWQAVVCRAEGAHQRVPRHQPGILVCHHPSHVLSRGPHRTGFQQRPGCSADATVWLRLLRIWSFGCWVCGSSGRGRFEAL